MSNVLNFIGIPNDLVACGVLNKALPATNASNYSDVLHLVQNANVEFWLQLQVPETPALADTKTLTLAFQDSANGTNGWADIAALPSITITGDGTAGGCPVCIATKLPSSASAYVRLKQTAEALAGDSTGVETVLHVWSRRV